jgi:CRP-like cAMP-binding protein
MSIEDDILFFERTPMLRLLGRTALRILALGAKSRPVARGEVLFQKGEDADCGYVIQSGSFSIAGKPGEEIVAAPPMLLGELAMIHAGVRAVTATAREDSAVITIPRGLFVKMLDSYPDAAARLRDHLAAHSEQAVRELAKVRAALLKPDRR